MVQDKVVKVITSGAFAAAIKQLLPIYEKKNSCTDCLMKFMKNIKLENTDFTDQAINMLQD